MTNQQKILEHFKQSYKRELKLNHRLSTEQLIERCLEDYGYQKNCEHYNYLLNWSSQYLEWDFLMEKINEQTEEVLFISPGKFQIQGNSREEYSIPFDKSSWEFALSLLAEKEHKDWNLENPFISFFTQVNEQTFRLSLSHSGLSPDNMPKAYFRVPNSKKIPLQAFSLTFGQQDLIKELISKKSNILVCGPTGSGKTTLMKSLIDLMSNEEHKVIIEDTLELENIPNSSHLLSKESKGFKMNDYCRYALRMKPDRIILGEMRGEEVVPFLLSSNTGHKGMISSLHANSALDAINRLALLFQIYSPKKGPTHQDLIKMICQGIDHIIFMQNKKVLEIIEILGCEGGTPYYNRFE